MGIETLVRESETVPGGEAAMPPTVRPEDYFYILSDNPEPLWTTMEDDALQPLSGSEYGGKVAEFMGVYQDALDEGREEVKDTSRLNTALARVRVFLAETDPHEVQEQVKANPDLRNGISVYAAVELAFRGNYGLARDLILEIPHAKLRDQLLGDLDEAARVREEQTSALSISDQDSEQNLGSFLKVLSGFVKEAPEDIKSKAEKVDTSTVHVGINRSLKSVKAMFAAGGDGRLTNLREISVSRHPNGAGDAPAEKKARVETALGYEHSNNLFLPPLTYGALTSENNPVDALSPYGEVLVELTDEAADRATYTIGDSSDYVDSPTAGVFSVDNPRKIQVSRDDAVEAYTYKLATGMSDYVEAQLQGVYVKDVERVTMPPINEGSNFQGDLQGVVELARAITSRGIKVRIPYKMPKDKSSITHGFVGETFESFSQRVQTLLPGVEILDTRSAEEKELTTGFVSREEAAAEDAAFHQKVQRDIEANGGVPPPISAAA